MSPKKVILLLLVLSLVALFFLLDLQRFFNLAYFQEQKDILIAYSEDNFWLSRIIYFFAYIIITALSLPAAGVITIIGGAIFGFWWGLLLVSFASTIGATLAFLVARTLLYDWVQDKFGDKLKPINRGIERDGMFYLFTLRMVPAFPFFLVNVLMALTPISVAAFYLVSQLGMLFGTALYINVGVELGAATTLPDIFSVGVIRAVVALAIFPWLARWVINRRNFRKAMKAYKKPDRFDTNMVVIGAGSAGLVTAYIASLVKASVTLIEKQRMGGDCLNTGCVPSKTLLRSAAVKHLSSRGEEFGLENRSLDVDFPAVMARVRNTIATIEPHDSRERYTGLGVDCIDGEAKILSPYVVQVNDREITTRHIVIATGARPFVPDLPGLDAVSYYTSDTIWNLEELPQQLLVAGGGPIGCELAQAFARLGAKVTIVQRGSRLLPKEDPEVSDMLEAVFREEGISVMTSTELEAFSNDVSGASATLRQKGSQSTLPFTHVLLALGRQANTTGFGLEELKVATNEDGTVRVNEFLQTSIPTIFACGDVAGPYQFTHMASFQSWFAAVNSLFGAFRKFRVNYKVVPWATFTDPEVARVGINEQEAIEQEIPYEISRFDLADLDRAIADSEARGFIKVLTPPGKDRILGVTIVGYHGAELISEFVLAMTHGLGLKKIMNTIHIYPTLSESVKFSAAQWRKQHAPQWLYPFLEKYHRWRRG